MVKCSCSSTFSLADTYSDEFGRLDFDRSQLGSGMSNRSKVKRFVTALNRLAERTNKRMFEFQELRQLAKDLQIQVNIIYITETLSDDAFSVWMLFPRLFSQVVDFEGFIGALNEQGYLLKKGHRTYQLQTIWIRQHMMFTLLCHTVVFVF